MTWYSDGVRRIYSPKGIHRMNDRKIDSKEEEARSWLRF